MVFSMLGQCFRCPSKVLRSVPSETFSGGLRQNLCGFYHSNLEEV
jgi:hypothetical protein